MRTLAILLLGVALSACAPNNLQWVDFTIEPTMTTCASAAPCRAYSMVEAPGVTDPRAWTQLGNLSPTFPFTLTYPGRPAKPYVASFQQVDLVDDGHGGTAEKVTARCSRRIDLPMEYKELTVHVQVVFRGTSCEVTDVSFVSGIGNRQYGTPSP